MTKLDKLLRLFIVDDIRKVRTNGTDDIIPCFGGTAIGIKIIVVNHECRDFSKLPKISVSYFPKSRNAFKKV